MNPEQKLSHSEQSRINGAKSKGPTSPAGKARSARNALRHGFASSTNVVLTIENAPAFQHHLEGFRATYRPQDYVEQTLIDQLAAIKWRQMRLTTIETTLLDAQISLLNNDIDEIYPDDAHDPHLHLVLGWQAIARQPLPQPKTDEEPDVTKLINGYDINSLDLVRRYLASAAREYHTTFNDFLKHRKLFGQQQQPQQPAALPAEPAPVKQPEPQPTKPQNPQQPNEPEIPLALRPIVVQIKPAPHPHPSNDPQSKR